MQRGLHVAILRNAALLVPASARAEWLAEWRAELWYVEHDATAFCLGSLRDAMWLRFRSFSARRAFSLDSPSRCLLFLSGLAAFFLWLAALTGGLRVLGVSQAGVKQFAVGLVCMYVESFLVLLTLNPLGLGEYPSNRHAPLLLVRLRRWVFLAIKIALLTPTLFLATAVVEPTFPPAASILFVGLIFGLRWVLTDQQRRCPVCLHFLANPLEIGRQAHMLLEPHGTEVSCARGHGSLYVLRTPTSWCGTQRWQHMGIPPSGGRRA